MKRTRAEAPTRPKRAKLSLGNGGLDLALAEEGVLLGGGLEDTLPMVDEVEIHLSETFSRARREVCTWSDLRRVRTRFLTPGHEPLIMTKSFLTRP